ncbi:MAG: enoyl-CoA hydratase-related protein, partial [Planctomycetota bacterium]|nr:enoyl-CoA hydratase-related protein [Planctomycetota bacterium]
MIHSTIADGVAVLRLSAPPLNTITYALLEELRAAIGRANREAAARSIVIIGDATHFSAGVDLGIFRAIGCREDAIRASRICQEAFQEVEDSGKPVVAAVAGKVIGAALELAMACHWRVCTRETSFSMPEVGLGINPGAGGTQRLPRLVGLDAALPMLLTGKPVDAQHALAAGLVDAICEGDALLEAARAVARPAGSPDDSENRPAPRKTSLRTDKVQDASLNAAAFERAKKLLARVPPEVIAPRRIAEAVRTGLEESFQAGLRAEQTTFADCMDTPAARNKIYLFFATRDTGKVGARHAVPLHEKPREIAKAAVIGMGAMGTGIAQTIITAGIPVIVRDENESALRKGTDRIAGSIQKRVEQGKLSSERAKATMGLLFTTT